MNLLVLSIKKNLVPSLLIARLLKLSVIPVSKLVLDVGAATEIEEILGPIQKELKSKILKDILSEF